MCWEKEAFKKGWKGLEKGKKEKMKRSDYTYWGLGEQEFYDKSKRGVLLIILWEKGRLAFHKQQMSATQHLAQMLNINNYWLLMMTKSKFCNLEKVSITDGCLNEIEFASFPILFLMFS